MRLSSEAKAQYRETLALQYSDKAKWISRLARDVSFSTSERVVGIAMCDYFNSKTGEAWPSISTLEKDAGTSRRTVIRALKKLELANYIIATKSRGRGRSNLYHFCMIFDEPENGATRAPIETSMGDKPASKPCQMVQEKSDVRAPLNRKIDTNIETRTSPADLKRAKEMALQILEKTAEFIPQSNPHYEALCMCSRDQKQSISVISYKGQEGRWFPKCEIRKWRQRQALVDKWRQRQALVDDRQ